MVNPSRGPERLVRAGQWLIARQRTLQRAELRIFGIRLLFVGPLLGLALWQFRRFRGSDQIRYEKALQALGRNQCGFHHYACFPYGPSCGHPAAAAGAQERRA
jgi:hypothetical protein